MNKVLKKIASFWPIFLIAFISYYSYVLWLEQSPKEVELSNSLEAKDIAVGSKVAGRIKKIYIDEGDYVKKGQLLLELEGDELVAQLNQAKYNYQRANHDFIDLQMGARPQEVTESVAHTKKTKAQLEESKLIYENKLSDYNKMSKLFSDGAISKKDLERFEVEKNTAEKAVDNLEQEYIKAVQREELIKEGPRKDQVKSYKANYLSNYYRFKELEKYASELNVIAPANGEISSFDLEVGELVSPNQPLLTITDLNDIFVRLYIPSTKLSTVKTNQEVKLVADSYPKDEFEGKITYISSKAEFTPRNIQTAEERSKLVYPVKIQVLNKNKKLRDGMYVTVKL